MLKSFSEVQAESTCQKRITVVEIFDKNFNLLSRESNRCSPTGGTCHRLGVVNGKADYPVDCHCNWTHAEIMAINALPKGSKPYRSILYGHDFYCDACEAALKKAGVEILDIQKNINV